jgi:hypothetical protein
MKNVTQGATVRLKATFKDFDGALTDPTAVTLTITREATDTTDERVWPDGTVIRESTGVFYYDQDTTVTSGVYHWHWEGTGPAPGAKQGEFFVRSTFPASEDESEEEEVDLHQYDPINVFNYMTAEQIADVQAFTYLLDVSDAIQAAIDALPDYGGTILFPGGGYRIEETIEIGDGDGVDASTRNGVKFKGLAGSWFIDSNGPAHNGGVVWKLYGSGHSGMIARMNGPVYNCSFDDISFQWHTDTGTAHGLTDNGGSGCSFNNLGFIDPPASSIGWLEYTAGLLGAARNHANNILFYLGHASSIGLLCTAVPDMGSGDRAFDSYKNILVIPTASTQTGIRLAYVDSVRIENYSCYPTGGAACVALNFDYTAYELFPNGCVISGYDPFGNTTSESGTPVTEIPTVGVADYENYKNRIIPFSRDNGTALPTLLNCVVVNDGVPGRQHTLTDTVASANNLVLGNSNINYVSGTTTINLLSSEDWNDGDEVCLVFQDTLTLKHNQASSGANKKIILTAAGDLTTAATMVVRLKLLSSVWYQI